MIAMSHEIAKLLLEHAGTFLARTEAIATAMKLGMPLSAIEEYLDWLDNTQHQRRVVHDVPSPEPPPARGEQDPSERDPALEQQSAE